MCKICVVEDEKELREILRVYLEKANFSVVLCENMYQATKFLNSDISMWIIDIMLPDGNGLELIKDLKQQKSDTPVIIISAKGDCFDRVTGFEVGCDDYIPKPFLPTELVYRVENLLKRVQLDNIDEDYENKILEIPPYSIDLIKRIIFENKKRIDLTSREYDIIHFFIENHGQAISRDFLLDKIWKNDYFGSDRVVDNYIKNIRKKLPKFEIETIYGFGYRYNK